MALLNINVRSNYLMGDTNVSVLMPQCPFGEDPQKFYENVPKYKVLWLLHGGLDDNSSWVRKSRLEEYVEKKKLIVVMPDAKYSFYTNCAGTHYNFSDYFLYELMPLIYSWFPASPKREDNYIAGLSMGGIGTLRFAASFPERFASAGVFSVGAVNLHEPQTHLRSKNIVEMMTYLNGSLENAIASPDNTWDRLVENKDRLPKMYACCGTADDHYESVYLPFKQHMQENGVPFTFFEEDGYEHEWAFWDQEIKKFLEQIED